MLFVDLYNWDSKTRLLTVSCTVMTYGEAMLKEALDDLKEGIMIRGKLIKDIRFVDDKGVLTRMQEGYTKA